MHNKTKLLWILLVINLIFASIMLLNRAFDWVLPDELITFVVFFIPILLLVFHSLFTLGAIRAIFFMLLAATVGLLFEIWGLHSGVIFGGNYIYRQESFMIFGVPYLVPVYWAIFVYTAYCISNSFLFWLQKRKPSKISKSLPTLLFLMSIDGILTVIIDLIMDPLQVHDGAWTWLDGGAYFGIPIGNFIGWFIVTITITGIFRLFEYYFSRSISIHKSIFLLPVVGYAAMSIAFFILALHYNFNTLAFLSLLLMMPVVFVNIVLYMKNKN